MEVSGGLLLPDILPLWHQPYHLQRTPLPLPVYGKLVLELETSQSGPSSSLQCGTDLEVPAPYPQPPGVAFSVEVGALSPSLELLNVIAICGLYPRICPRPWQHGSQQTHLSNPCSCLSGSFFWLQVPGDSLSASQEFFWGPLPSCPPKQLFG